MTREILAVRFTAAEARKVARNCRALDRQNVEVYREKIRAANTWRWGWVIVADAPKKG